VHLIISVCAQRVAHSRMAEPLKEMFNVAHFERLAGAVSAVVPGFKRAAFMKEVTRDLGARELNARMRHASIALHAFLPGDYRMSVKALKDVAPRMPKGYTALLYPDFVGLYGLNDPAYSLEALKHFTSYGSSEFAVREFIRRDVKGTLKQMRQWAEDESADVRRLASEGSRPRLPWSFRLDAIVKEPKLTTPILERLKEDPSLYVRKSVANHLNDFSKDHPAYLVELLRSWDLTNAHTAWIAKRACRTLIKAGDAKALTLFAFNTKVDVRVEKLTITPRRLKLGGTLQFNFIIRSTTAQAQQLVVDYAIHYRKAAGHANKKVFKLKEVELVPRASMAFAKSQRIADLSTRKHHPGLHTLEILVNGKVLAKETFDLLR
jgi:3-methyladenine DNA glycosylase AlkC